MGGTGSLAVQIGGLQMQGAAFDGTRFSELTQVRGLAEGRQLAADSGPMRPCISLRPLVSLRSRLPSDPCCLQLLLTAPHCSSLQDAPVSRTVPPMSVAWIPRETAYPYGTACMAVPLYYGQDRARVLTEVQMPVSGEDEVRQWTLAGLALFLSA